MKPEYDYFYNFPPGPLRVRGRCRVRVYARKNNAYTIVLTELNSNVGESITEACASIATDLTALRGLNPKKTRWIHHDPPHDGEAHVIDELRFTWDNSHHASDPQWQPLDDMQVEALTGDTLEMLNRRLGDQESRMEKVVEDEPTEAKGTTRASAGEE